MPRDPSVVTGGGAGSQPSPAQLRLLVQQIQMAVQAGHLNPQILNQPLAPQTLVLLSQLLQQIKVLQQLSQQQAMAAMSRPGSQGPMGSQMLQQLVPQMNKTKQQIASLQQQIATQQALYVKQQQTGQFMTNQQPPGVPPNQPSDPFKVDPVHCLKSNFDQLSMQDPGQQSRLTQWKFPKDPMDLGLPDFSRAPGSSAAGGGVIVGGGGGGGGGVAAGGVKPPLGSSLSSPNMNPVLGQEGAWSTLSRTQSETGWPESTTSDLSGGGGGEVKDSWGSAGGSSSYAISDLVPEFEPGKPWKGPQIKTADDDPTLTPGTFAMSGLNEADVYANNGNKGMNSAKASPPPSGGGAGSGASNESGFATLGLSSSTWSFNPSSSSSAAPTTSTPYSSAKLGPKSSWSDAPPPAADPWSAPKPRGPPPGISAAGATGSVGGPKTSVGGREWSTASQSPWTGSAQTSATSSWVGSLNGSSSWLVLRNLTPQIDGSTLKTLCVQHGPLHNFHLYLSHGVALVRYSTGEEAAKVGYLLCFFDSNELLY